jgi:hypothetical protein
MQVFPTVPSPTTTSFILKGYEDIPESIIIAMTISPVETLQEGWEDKKEKNISVILFWLRCAGLARGTARS